MCGVDCGLCPSYQGNLRTQADRQRCSDGWSRYLGFRLNPARLLQCEGCLVPTVESPVRYFKGGCYLRKCGERNGVPTCAHCSGFPCEDVEHHGTANTRDTVARRLGITPEAIPAADYEAFIKPYESFDRLERIRATLSPSDIIAMTSPTPSKALSFPKTLKLPKAKEKAFKGLHKLLSNIILMVGETHARDTVVKKRKRYLLKLLWVVGVWGELKEGKPTYLTINSDTYFKHLKGVPFYTNWDAVKRRFDLLKEMGVLCSLVPLTVESWVSSKGALKKRPWLLRMAFARKIGDTSTLIALKEYTTKLTRQYGSEGFKYFARGDMHRIGEGV